MKKSAKRNKLIIIHKDLNDIYTGGQYHLAEFISYVKNKDIKCEIIDSGSLSGQIRKSKLVFLIYFLKYFLQYRKHIFIFAAHSMHLRLILPFFISRFFGNHYGVLCLQTFYNFRQNPFMKWFGFFCEFLFLHGASHLIFSSKVAVDYFKPFHINHKSRSIVNPAPKVLSKRKTSIRRDVRKLLFVGQVKQWKGLDILLKALAKLTDMNLCLDVAGMYDNESKYYIMLNEIIQKNNLEKKIHFHGNLSTQDLVALYRQADIFILPSRYETYGMVLLEAMSFGLPIIASTIPSAKQIIKDQVNGIFFENNDPDSLAQAIHQLYFDKNKRESIRRNNLKVSSTLRTWSTVTEETYKAISEFL